MKRTLARLFVFLAPAIAVAACSNGVAIGPSDPANWTPAPAASTSTPVTTTPTTPAPPSTPATTTAAVAYTPDLQPIFNGDCVPCHGARSAAGRYSMTTYAGVMAAVTPRSASSPLVLATQPGGVMYSFLSGDRAGKSAMIRTWVLNGAPQTR
jgi:hypothetical protein